MNVWILSDLHVKHAPYMPMPPRNVDAVAIAGDIGDSFKATADWLNTFPERVTVPVVYVPGNHDFFGSDLHGAVSLDGHFAGTNVHVLSAGESVDFDGRRFMGATLWTDFKIAFDVYGAETWAAANMPDHQEIRMGDRKARPRDLAELHARHLDALQESLSRPHAGSRIVVTHHAPHPKSLRNAKVSDLSDAAFASDLSDTIKFFKPQLWIHGHLHTSRNYRIGDTRIICNPRGYVSPTHVENPAFDPALVMEI